MANTIAQQVQALYVGYLGRAADKAGLDFWTGAIESGKSTLESVALGFTSSAEYQAKYAGLDNAGLVAAVYQNVLGRPADAEGKAFWVGEIDKGVITADTLLAAMLNSLGAVDQQVIDNKVFVAQSYTSAAGAEYDATAGAKILADVDGTAASVTAALNTLPANVSALSAGLAGVDAANANLHNFYAALDLNFDGKADYTADQAKAPGFDSAASAALSSALGDAKSNAYVTGTTAAQIDAELALTKANLDAQLTTDQKTLADLNTLLANFSKTTDGAGASAAVATYLAADAANTAATKAATLSQADLDAAKAKLESLASDSVTVTAGAKVTLTNTGTVLATYDSTSKTYVLASGITEAKYVGVTGYLSALNADVAAENAATVAGAKLAAATSSVSAFTADVDPVTAGSKSLSVLANDIKTANAAIATDNQKIADNNSAVATYKQLVAVDAQQTALEKAVTDATATLDKAGYTVSDVVAGPNVATSGSDAFIFNDQAASSILNFGLQGKDVLYVGADYTLNTGDYTKGVGNNSALEVFFTQGVTATDSKVVIETSPFGSNVSGTPEVATIDLTGVSVDHLSFANGYVQVV